MIFNTVIAGVPCKCEVALYSPDFDYQILDMNNRPMPSLKASIDQSTELRLLDEYRFEDMIQYWGH